MKTKKGFKKLSLDRALDKYYYECLERGEIEAVSENHLEIIAQPFASYLNCLALLNHWGKVLREVLNKTVYVTASYYSYKDGELKHETKEYLSKKDFLKSLADA